MARAVVWRSSRGEIWEEEEVKREGGRGGKGGARLARLSGGAIAGGEGRERGRLGGGEEEVNNEKWNTEGSVWALGVLTKGRI